MNCLSDEEFDPIGQGIPVRRVVKKDDVDQPLRTHLAAWSFENGPLTIRTCINTERASEEMARLMRAGYNGQLPVALLNDK